MDDLISRKAAIDALDEQIEQCNKALGSFDISLKDEYAIKVERASLKAYKDQLENLPTAQPEILACGEGELIAQPEQRWIPCSERLPEDTRPVNITWVNRKPESYYADIKDVPFTATGHYCKGKWYWYSATCQDYLDEYGECEVDAVDNMIEIIAWMPLPEPYMKEGDT